MKIRVLRHLGPADADNESGFTCFLGRALGSLRDAIVGSAGGICNPANPRPHRVAKPATTNLLLVLIVLAAPTGRLQAQSLYVIEKDGLYGFSEKSGKPVIPPKYGLVKPFSEGLAPVYISGAWGFVDLEGNMKIEPHFLGADNFSDGLAAVRQKGGWGYIDDTGKFVIPPRYFQARRFSEEVAPVRGETGWLFIDKTGAAVVGLSGYDDANSFKDGLAAVKLGAKWRFISHSGKKKFDLEFANVSNFDESLAAVQEDPNGKYGFIDSSGDITESCVWRDKKKGASFQ